MSQPQDYTQQQPYSAPQAPLSVSVPRYQPRWLSLKGRLGRMRYVVYGAGIGLLMNLIVLAAVLLMAIVVPLVGEGAINLLALPLALLAVAVFVYMLVMLIGYAVRRLNDIGASGWWSLLFLVPLVNLLLTLLLLLLPGTAGENRYGPAPQANSGGVIAGFVLLLVFMVGYLGMVAAVAIPAYQDYVQKAAMAAGM